MHRAVFAGEAFQPQFLAGEDQNRGQPCGQAVVENVQNSTRRAAAFGVAVVNTA